MKKLDIEWLHKENKEGRRSGRTTEMLANVVGAALVLDEDSEIFVVCAPGSEEATANSLFDVFHAIAPVSHYYAGEHRGVHYFTVRDKHRDVLIRVQHNRIPEGYLNGKKKPVLEFIDHYFFEYNKNMEIERNRRDSFRENRYDRLPSINELTPYFKRK